MAVVQALVQIPDTFGELAEHLFSTIKWQTKDALRTDIVFDTYPENSIKNAEHLKRAQKRKLKVNVIKNAPGIEKSFCFLEKTKSHFLTLLLENGQVPSIVLSFMALHCLCHMDMNAIESVQPMAK